VGGAQLLSSGVCFDNPSIVKTEVSPTTESLKVTSLLPAPILCRLIRIVKMKETSELHAEIEHEIEQAHLEHRELPLGYEDPHKAALEDNPEEAERLTIAVILSAIFLGTSFTGPIIFGFILATPILVQLGERLGGANISFW
jgi:hypothetical protein